MLFQDRLVAVTGLGSFVVATVVLAAMVCDSDWRRGCGAVDAQYSARSSQHLTGHVDINIGLTRIQTNLCGVVANTSLDVRFYKEYSWLDTYFEIHLKKELARGAPYPILTILEHLREDYGWGVKLALAGRFATVVLWLAVAASLYTTAVTYKHQARTTAISAAATASLLLAACYVYDFILPPNKPLVMRLGEGPIIFLPGLAYFTVFYLGFTWSCWAGLFLLMVLTDRGSYDGTQESVMLLAGTRQSNFRTAC